MEVDKRFALTRDGTRWYAVRLVGTFRLTERGKSRDAFGKAFTTTDITEVARLVIKEGKGMRCAREGARAANSLDLLSRGVTGYELDPAIATKLGVSPRA